MRQGCQVFKQQVLMICIIGLVIKRRETWTFNVVKKSFRFRLALNLTIQTMFVLQVTCVHCSFILFFWHAQSQVLYDNWFGEGVEYETRKDLSEQNARGGPEGATKENSYVMKFGLRVCQRNNGSVGLCVAGARVAGFVQGTQEQ